MKQFISSSIRLTLLCLILFSGIYPLFIWLVAQVAPGQGRGEQLYSGGVSVGYQYIGQRFSQDKYFSSRPSAANYDASASVGSNKGPSNPDYLLQVQSRIDTFLVHNPAIERSAIPAELVTASGSGLDPDITLHAALVQVPRVATARAISAEKVRELVVQHSRGPLLGLFGNTCINVAKLNLALDNALPSTTSNK